MCVLSAGRRCSQPPKSSPAIIYSIRPASGPGSNDTRPVPLVVRLFSSLLRLHVMPPSLPLRPPSNPPYPRLHSRSIRCTCRFNRLTLLNNNHKAVQEDRVHSRLRVLLLQARPQGLVQADQVLSPSSPHPHFLVSLGSLCSLECPCLEWDLHLSCPP
uniref:Uncharacterized protein n=1 Tax=Cacopsylla melanoneura TaxID=428564 RepID=A0A8D8W0C6_9HEMI